MWELKVYKGEDLMASVVPTLFAFDKLFCVSVGHPANVMQVI